MEAFLATNASQWDVIQNVIDQCDYYVLIIGGRYGSITEDGISYTEKEFNYAKKIKLPILAFVHGSVENIPSGKTERDEKLREKLETFRSRVMKEFPVRDWTTPHQLGSLVSRSLIQEVKKNPRPGWVRNDGTSPVALLERIDSLSQENSELKDKLRSDAPSHIAIEELSSGSDLVTLSGVVNVKTPTDNFYGQGTSTYWDSQVSWDSIFKTVGPRLINEAADDIIRRDLARFWVLDEEVKEPGATYNSSTISQASFADVIVQLRALGLIDKGVKKRGINDKSGYWQLTEYGDRYLVGLLAKRKSPDLEISGVIDEEEAV